MKYKAIVASAVALGQLQLERLFSNRSVCPNTDKRTGGIGMRRHMRMLPVFLAAVVAFVLGAAAPQLSAAEVEFDEAEIFFEFNSTDLDLGIQLFFDAEGWKKVDVAGPDGKIFKVNNMGSLKEIGSTEVFTESEEPELDEGNLEAEMQAFMDLFPPGEYEFSGNTIEGDHLVGTADLTHDLPAAASLDLEGYPTIEWTDNTDTGAGDPGIVGYQVVVELVVEASDERLFEFSIDLPGDATEVTVPDDFIDLAESFDEEDIEEYKVEIIAEEESGNKTITEESLLEEEE